MKLWIFFTLVSAVFGVKEECPGGKIECSDNSTCCQLSNASYGCCPLKDAVCCDDHIHCCPINTKCSVDLCIQNTVENATVLAHSLNSDIVCPDHKYVCPNHSTCCETLYQTYACCPLDNAVCCEDKIHCCPQNTVCDIKAGHCIKKGFISNMYNSLKNHAYQKKKSTELGSLKHSEDITSVVCPGGSFQCPDSYTCCKLQSGEWGCCPFQNAFCCSDHLHCCPENFKCDTTSESCIQGTKNVSASLNIPSRKVVADQICPDQQTHCLDSMTCCAMKDGHYGCCPYFNAVCCGDGSHCCPENYTCDLVFKQCIEN